MYIKRVVMKVDGLAVDDSDVEEQLMVGVVDRVTDVTSQAIRSIFSFKLAPAA